MTHPVAQRALLHFNALFPPDDAITGPKPALTRQQARKNEHSGEVGCLMNIEKRARSVDERPRLGAAEMTSLKESGDHRSRPTNVSRHQPTLVSLFAGAGGLDIGLEQAGFRSVLATDINHDACETLRSNRHLHDIDPSGFDAWALKSVISQRCHAGLKLPQIEAFVGRIRGTIGHRRTRGPDQVIEGDIRLLTAEKILGDAGLKVGELDLLAGGPPCQPFSRAGKREMMSTSDGLLFLEFIRLIDDIQPRFFLFENVKGMVIQKSPVKTVKCVDCGHIDLPKFESIYLMNDGDRSTTACVQCQSADAFVNINDVRGGALQIVENEFRKTGYRIHSAVLNAADFGAPQARERIIIVGSRDGETFQFPAHTHSAKVGQNRQHSFLTEALQPWVTMADSIFSKPHRKYGQLSHDKARLWVKNVVRPHDEPVTWTLDRIAPTVGAHQSAKLAIAPYGVPEAQLQRQQWHVHGRRQGDTPPVPVEHEYLSDEDLLALQTFPTDWYLHGTRMERAFQIGNAVPPILAKAIGSSLISQLTTQVSEAA